MSEPIWIDNLEILFEKDRLIDFFPTQKQTRAERINSLARLSLYISIILSLYYSDIKFMAIFVFFMLLSYLMYNEADESEYNVKPINEEPVIGMENLENGECTKPTIDNPFMNATMKDYMTFDKNGTIVDRPVACNPNTPDVKKTMDTHFNNNLYKDVSDVFGKSNSQRQFFTMPYTTIPNDQESFARWLYLNPKTCKEDQDYCLGYEDIRSKRFIMPNPEKNPISTKKLEN